MGKVSKNAATSMDVEDGPGPIAQKMIDRSLARLKMAGVPTMKKAPKKFVRSLQKKRTSRMGMTKLGPKRTRHRKDGEGEDDIEGEGDKEAVLAPGVAEVITKAPRVVSTSVKGGCKTPTSAGVQASGNAGGKVAGRARPSRDPAPMFGSTLAAGAAFTPPGMKAGEAAPLASDWLAFQNKPDRGVNPDAKKKQKKKFNKKGRPVVKKTHDPTPSKRAAAFIKSVDDQKKAKQSTSSIKKTIVKNGKVRKVTMAPKMKKRKGPKDFGLPLEESV